MTWRTGLLLALLVSLVLWLLLYLLVVTGYRAVHEAVPPDPRMVAVSAGKAFVADMDGMPTTSTTTTTLKARPAPTVRVSRPTPTPAVAVGEIPSLIRQMFGRFGADVGEQAVKVFGCETGGTYNPRATNGSHAGLAQISRRWHGARIARLGFTWEQMFEATPNLTVAADIFAEQGWRPWTCARIVGVR